MKKSLLLLVPLLVLAGCSINGLNPFGGSNTENGGLGGLASFSIIIVEPEKGTIDVDELNIVSANFRLIDGAAVTQTTNWVPPMIGNIKFNPIASGTANLRLIDTDVTGVAATNSTNVVVRGGYNYVIRVTLGGLIYMIETNAGASTVSNYMAVYSETHAVPTGNNVFDPLNGANLSIWQLSTVLTEISTGLWEGSHNWQITRPAGTNTWIGFGITSTNGLKNKAIYSGGHLKFAVKAFNSNNTYKVGMISVTAGVTNDKFVNLTAIPGYAADGNWKNLSVPMSDFGIDYNNVSCYFYFTSVTLQTNTNTAVYLDDIYWSRD